MTEKCAVFAMIIGDKYVSPWATRFLPGWLAYCEKFDLDLVVYFEPFDYSERAKKRKVNWQKCLAITSEQAREYKQVAWLDADIAINSLAAPNIFTACPPSKVGAVGLNSLPHQCHLFTSPTQPSVENLHEAWSSGGFIAAVEKAYSRASAGNQGSPQAAAKGIANFYKSLGYAYDVMDTFNSGVFVISPKIHGHLFQKIYDKFEQHAELRVSDNIPIPAEIIHAGLLAEIDSRFNVVLYTEIASRHPALIFPGMEYEKVLFHTMQSIFVGSYFLHFAGTQNAQNLFVPVAHSWPDMLRIGGTPFPALYLDENNIDSIKHCRSYFDKVEAIFGFTRSPPRFKGGRFVFRPSDLREKFSRKATSANPSTGLYREEYDAESKLTFRWVQGRGASLSFDCDLESGSLAKFCGKAILIGRTDKRFLDALQVLIVINGYFSIRYESTRSDPEAGQVTTIFFDGFTVLENGQNRVSVIAPSWTPFVGSSSVDARSLSVPLSEVQIDFEVIPCHDA